MSSRKKDECRRGASGFLTLAEATDYKSGARKNPIMGGQAGSLNSQDMADLAAFYSRQKGSLHVIR